MNQELLEKHESLLVELSHVYLDNMELELGKKYINRDHQIDARLSDPQYTDLKSKHNLSGNEFAEVYFEFLKLQPTKHLKQVMDAFTASGGNVDIEPVYDEHTQRLSVSVSFIVKDSRLEKIEGLSSVEDFFVKLNAMIQVETVLSGSDPDVSPTF